LIDQNNKTAYVVFGWGEKVNKLVLATVISVVAVSVVGVIGEAVKTIDVTAYEDPPRPSNKT